MAEVTFPANGTAVTLYWRDAEEEIQLTVKSLVMQDKSVLMFPGAHGTEKQNTVGVNHKDFSQLNCVLSSMKKAMTSIVY